MLRLTHYQIHVSGVVGSTAGYAAEGKDGVAISETGRFCSVLGRKARRFQTEAEALAYIQTRKDKDRYDFSIVQWWGHDD